MPRKKQTPYRKIVVKLNKIVDQLKVVKQEAEELDPANPTSAHIVQKVGAAIEATTVPDTHQWAS